MNIGEEQKPFIAEPVEDPFSREVPVPDAVPAERPEVDVTEEPLVPA